ncbi:hypothetical protein TUBRATIS_16100 [Tubulinosema ratisbonensis]|uniref:Uncharacterized protein n=1 Tax=Tubulinosema ratisbonensis TaxID=291195 RepID=A0A437AL68_9MICR|nr:hypothetical protein TUBRATIS_16100 [Tubulinosema ratisbonensis]
MTNSKKKVRKKSYSSYKHRKPITNCQLDNPDNKIAYFFYIVNEYLQTLFISYFILKIYPLISYVYYAIIYITLKTINLFISFKIYKKHYVIYNWLLRLRFYFDDVTKLTFIGMFSFFCIKQLIRIFKFCISELDSTTFAVLLIVLICSLIFVYLFVKIIFYYFKHAYFFSKHTIIEIYRFLHFRIMILSFIYLILFISIEILFLQSIFIFGMLILLLLIIFVAIIFPLFLFKGLHFRMDLFDDILFESSFLLFFCYLINLLVFCEFVLSKCKDRGKIVFYLFDKMTYLDERMWMHRWIDDNY